jgi:hypothetical protein
MCPEMRDYLSACRIMRLLTNGEKTGTLTRRAMREIKVRLLMLHPSCDNTELF